SAWPASTSARAQAIARVAWPRPRPWTTRLTRAISGPQEGARGHHRVADGPAQVAVDLPPQHGVAHVGRMDRHARWEQAPGRARDPAVDEARPQARRGAAGVVEDDAG